MTDVEAKKAPIEIIPGMAPLMGQLRAIVLQGAVLAGVVAVVMTGNQFVHNSMLAVAWFFGIAWIVYIVARGAVYEKTRQPLQILAYTLIACSTVALAGLGNFVTAFVYGFGTCLHAAHCRLARNQYKVLDEEAAP